MHGHGGLLYTTGVPLLACFGGMGWDGLIGQSGIFIGSSGLSTIGALTQAVQWVS